METNKKLNPEFKAKWVAALRSGEYEQGTGVLYNPEENTHCCLGVACAIATGINPEGNYIGEYDWSVPEELKLLSGTPSDNEIVKTLTYMNDSYVNVNYPKQNVRKHSFLEIADYIEANL